MLNCASTSSAGGHHQRTMSLGCQDGSTPGTSFHSTNFNSKSLEILKKRGSIFRRNSYFRKQLRMKIPFIDSSPLCMTSDSPGDHLIFQNGLEKRNQVRVNSTPACGTKRKLDSDSFQRKMPRYSSPVQVPSIAYCEEDSFAHMSSRIWDLYSIRKQSESTFMKKIGLTNKLQEILCGLYPGCRLFIVGSSMSGLGTNDCDLDLCLTLKESAVHQNLEDITILESVQDELLKFGFLRNIMLITAKVPILRMQDLISGCEVDLNFNNEVGIRNTELLQNYARIDARVPPLVLIVKLWARFHDINDAKSNTLSSYSLVLMVIHYLQYRCQPPVVPSLQEMLPDRFQHEELVSQINMQEAPPYFFSRNNSSVGQLFLGFLNYYANEFDFSRVISVRLANVTSKAVAMKHISPKNKIGHWKWVCIEEPFDRTNTACSVCNPRMFKYVKDVFKQSWNVLNRVRQLDAVLEF